MHNPMKKIGPLTADKCGYDYITLYYKKQGEKSFTLHRLSIKAHLRLSPHYSLREKRCMTAGTKPSRHAGS